MSNPIGLHIQAQNFTEQQKRLLYAHCAKAQYTTVTVMDNYDVAMDLVTIMPNCVVVFRDSNYEPSPKDPGDFVWWLNAHNKPDPRSNKIVLMINCEQGFGVDRVEMWAWMIRKAKEHGRILCVGNTSAGTPQPEDWLLAKPLFVALAECGGYLAVHEYSYPYPWATTNGANPVGREHEWPKVDWSKPQYHIGRLVAIPRACKVLNVPCPPLIVTEGFIDNMGDIERLFGYKGDGWQMLAERWTTLFYKGRNAGDILADYHIWSWEEVYALLGCVIGTHVYTYGDANGWRWRNYRVDETPSYLKRMQEYHPIGQIPPEENLITTLQNPLPLGDPRWVEGSIKPANAGDVVNLRLAPQTTLNKPIGKLAQERKCLGAQDATWGDWMQVYFPDASGTLEDPKQAWVSTTVATFTPKPVIEMPQTTLVRINTIIEIEVPVDMAVTLADALKNATIRLTSS